MKIIAHKPAVFAALVFGFALPAFGVPVTFQVNMEVQATIGTFNPSAHSVELRGSFDNWGPGAVLAPTATNASVYEATVDISGNPGTVVQFKFVINQAGTLVWEMDGVGPGGAANRAINLPASAETLPAVYFNNQSTPPGVVAVTFQVNMEIQDQIGNFDPAMHTVEARGSFDNWGPGITLSANPTNANIYQGTVNVTGTAGTMFEYKFVMNQAGTLVWEGNVGSGGPFGNRTFALAASSQILPLVYFNNLTNNPGAGIRVTFQANMVVQFIRGAFDPASGVVDVRGPFNNWGTPSGFILTNSPANPYLFVGTLSISNASPGNAIPYKFTMNGTWEMGDDRTFILAPSDQTLPPRHFDDLSNLGPITVTPGSFPGDVVATWTAYPRVRLQITTDLSNPDWQDVPNSEGQSTATVSTTDRIFLRLIGP